VASFPPSLYRPFYRRERFYIVTHEVQFFGNSVFVIILRPVVDSINFFFPSLNRIFFRCPLIFCLFIASLFAFTSVVLPGLIGSTFNSPEPVFAPLIVFLFFRSFFPLFPLEGESADSRCLVLRPSDQKPSDDNVQRGPGTRRVFSSAPSYGALSFITGHVRSPSTSPGAIAVRPVVRVAGSIPSLLERTLYVPLPLLFPSSTFPGSQPSDGLTEGCLQRQRSSPPFSRDRAGSSPPLLPSPPEGRFSYFPPVLQLLIFASSGL